VSWARYETQRLWRGEEYLLHIDSHSRFLAGWDEHLIDELAACPSPKPYLTGYPGAYRMGEPLPATAPISGLAPWEWFEGGVVRLYAVDRGPDRTAFVPTPFVAGGFSFARAELLAEVPYDPYLEYNEEEITLSLRLYTHGWDGFVAREGQLFHLYGMDKPRDQRFRTELGRRDRMTLWDRSLARYRHLVGLEHSTDPRVVAELEHFGLGRSRTLEEFEAVSGIQFWSQTSAAAAEVPEADDRPLAVVLPLGVPRDAARA
jgi:hypothetical protein